MAILTSPKLPYNFYPNLPIYVGNIEVTMHQFDALASYYCTKKTQKAAKILDLSPKTIDTHLQKIMIRKKDNLKNMTDLLSFVDSCNKAVRDSLDNHYRHLKVEELFRDTLRKIARIKKVTYTIENEDNINKMSPFFQLKKHLEIVGTESKEASKEQYCIKNILKITNSEQIKNNSEDKTPIFALTVCVENDMLTSVNKNDEGHLITLESNETYYDSVLQIIKKIFFTYNFIDIIQDFEGKRKNILDGIKSKEDENTPTEENHCHSSKLFNFNKKWLIAINIIFTVICLSVLCLLISRTTLQPFPIDILPRSEMILPNDSVLLKREHIIKQMVEKLKDKNKIQTIALIGVVGIGGAGKTTLARFFGHSYKASVVWEINAESHDSLVSSFFDLAQSFCKTKEKREELTLIKSMQDTVEREKQLISCIKENLKLHPNWLLIYDNVDSFHDIQTFFPRDVNVWGEGKVIITTRDNNLLNANYIEAANIIQVDQLSHEEALTLFCKIYYQKNGEDLTPEEKQNTQKFLIHVPPFPLDVSVTAFYMKSTFLNFNQYLERISKKSKSFDNEQQLFVKKVTNYAKTRQAIITSSFDKLIEINSEYKELLLLMCLMDSQDIPITFFEFYKDPVLIGKFIRDLRKYSLITGKIFETAKGVMFSLHRSTQEIGRRYLVSLLTNDAKKIFLDQYISSVKKFYKSKIKKNSQEITSLIPHLDAFVNNLNHFHLSKDDHTKYLQNILYILGYAYFECMRDFFLAEKYFKRVYNIQIKKQYLSDSEYAIMLKDLADSSVELENVDDALFYADNSIELYTKIPQSKILIAKNLRIKGYAYTCKNDFEKSNDCFNQALQKISDIKSDERRDLEASVYSFMGILHSLTYICGEKANKSLEYCHRAVDIAEGNQLDLIVKNQKMSSCEIAAYKASLGRIYARFGKYKEAYFYSKEAENIVDNAFNNCSFSWIKGFIESTQGELYLRLCQFKDAKNKLTESIKKMERLMGKNNRHVVVSKIFYIEMQIRLGELNDAYDKYLEITKISQKSHTNYVSFIRSTGHYHAAVIKQKQNNFKKSYEHFNDFIIKVKSICKDIINEEKFQSLEKMKAFDVPNYDVLQPSETIKKCFQQALYIFTAVYGEEHPFVKDYVILNSKEVSQS